MYKNTDKGVIREYLNEGVTPAGESCLLKLYLGTVSGDSTKGIAKTFSWKIEKIKAVVTNIGQNDVVYSGGIYQLGDIKVQLQRELKPIDDAMQCPGDRIVWRGHEYRQVGRIATSYLENYVLYDYIYRRI